MTRRTPAGLAAGFTLICAVLGALRRSGIGRVSVALSAGNFAAIGYKPA